MASSAWLRVVDVPGGLGAHVSAASSTAAPQHRRALATDPALYTTTHEAFQHGFQHPGPFWARHYIFTVKGRPLTVILEVFNTRELGRYLGALPTSAPPAKASGAGVARVSTPAASALPTQHPTL